MSHQDAKIRALMRAKKKIAAAKREFRNAGEPELQSVAQRFESQVAQQIDRRLEAFTAQNNPRHEPAGRGGAR